MMAISVIIGVFVGLVVGCASMAMWAARRIGDEAARQFDRGFERGRWLADLTHDPPPLLIPRRYRPAEPRTYAGR
jgi:hypothetical protein